MSQINNIAVIFKELSILVVEQGTVLDRIDFNVEAARLNVNKANVELTKTLIHEKSSRVKGCMSCLITGILISASLLALKYID